MLLNPASYCFSILFAATPPHGAIKFRLMSPTAPVKIVEFLKFHGAYLAHLDSKIFFTFVFSYFINSLLHFVSLFNQFGLIWCHCFNIINLILNNFFQLKNLIICSILKNLSSNHHKHFLRIMFLPLFHQKFEILLNLLVINEYFSYLVFIFNSFIN